jgi:hypothetical protein
MGLANMYQYGDTGKVYGDIPLPIHEHDTSRHVGGNANGIKPYTKNKGMLSMSSNLRGLQAGSVSIIESKVECQEYEWRENTYQTLRKTFGDERVEYSTSKTKFGGRYKSGGTVTSALGNWSHRVVDSGSNATGCGHWIYVTYVGKIGKRLTYITVYRVCDQKDPGDIMAWKQKQNIQYEYDTVRVGKIDPHKQTLVDLEYFVDDLRNKGHDVEIFIDANQNDRRCYRLQGHADHFESNTGFNIDGRIDGSLKMFLQNAGLYNALNNKHGSKNVPPAREPGSKVTYYVCVSEGLLPHIAANGMLRQDAVFASDHRTFFMDLDVESYFGCETDSMPAKQLHQLQLDDPRIADEYWKKLHKLFSTHNVYRRVTKITERSNSKERSILDEDDYEKIDQDITRSMLSAATKCGIKNKKTGTMVTSARNGYASNQVLGRENKETR